MMGAEKGEICKLMDKRFLAILAVIIIIFVGVFAFSKSSDSNSTGSSGSNAKPTSHISGQGKKGVTLMEYGDYQCPICARFYPTVEQVREKYAQDIYFQFRNLPLISVHPNAFVAARAAEAAGLQNKYWEMYQKLYVNQDAWASSSNPLSIFKDYARQLSLDVNKFSTDFASSQVNDAINADLTAFGKTGQDQATPTFFLDGKALNNQDLIDPQTGVSLDKFSKIIDAEIAQKSTNQ